jgi:hypothetical protein
MTPEKYRGRCAAAPTAWGHRWRRHETAGEHWERPLPTSCIGTIARDVKGIAAAWEARDRAALERALTATEVEFRAGLTREARLRSTVDLSSTQTSASRVRAAREGHPVAGRSSSRVTSTRAEA